MAKKAQKGKPAKKDAKPVKKAAVKKPAPKKVAKPAKPARPSGGKAIAKKPVVKVAPKKNAKPVKKVVVKKPVKKVIAKKGAKKVTPKKIIKPAKKAIAKKIVPKKVVKPSKKIVAKKALKKVVAKKVVAKKVIAKKVVAKKIEAKPVQKIAVKPVAKPVAKIEPKKVIEDKPIIIAKPITPIVKKAVPVLKKKLDPGFDMDEESRDDEPMLVEYKTPSILRPMGPVPTPHVNNDKRTRYTDAELKEFKELILKKLAEAQKDYELLKSTLSHKDDHGTDDTSPTFKLLEDGSDVLSKEETSHLAGRQEKFIQNLQNALIRIENKTYGICRVTGKLISKERLRSVPHATLVIEAKLDQNA